jgi:hypothetical protein
MAVMLKNYRDVALERKDLRARALRAEREAGRAKARLETAGRRRTSGVRGALGRRLRRVLRSAREARLRRAR